MNSPSVLWVGWYIRMWTFTHPYTLWMPLVIGGGRLQKRKNRVLWFSWWKWNFLYLTDTVYLSLNYPEIYCNVFLTYRDYLISECQAKKKAQSKHDWQAVIMKVSLVNCFVWKTCKSSESIIDLITKFIGYTTSTKWIRLWCLYMHGNILCVYTGTYENYDGYFLFYSMPATDHCHFLFNSFR